jgi:hypothetical protein
MTLLHVSAVGTPDILGQERSGAVAASRLSLDASVYDLAVMHCVIT